MPLGVWAEVLLETVDEPAGQITRAAARTSFVILDRR